MPVTAAEGYRVWAAHYDEDPNPLLALEARLAAPFVAPLGGRRFLDVCTGTGRWMEYAALRGALVCGIDLCREMLLKAASKRALEGKLALADAGRLPFADASADIAVCSFGLGYLPSVRQAISEMARVARRVILSDLHPRAAAEGWRRGFRANGAAYELEYYAHSEHEIEQAARSAGLTLDGRIEAPFGEPERELFRRAGQGGGVRACAANSRAAGDGMARAVRLAGGRVALDGARAERIDVTIAHGRILPFDTGGNAAGTVDVSGLLLLPGLINAHDHLEFALFPRLGRGPYPNAKAWATDIYHPDEAPIKECLAVPKEIRLRWGGLRNLLSGVTAVAHHNPYERTFRANFPVRVVRRYGWAHSLDFSPDLAERYRRTPRHYPFLVHAAEGTDESARNEIGRLRALGVLGPNTVVVHGVGASPTELPAVGGVVWCPSSNLFTLGQTLSAAALRSGAPVALGTDSSLTAAGDLADEWCAARRFLPGAEIYPMLTTQAARVLRLSSGEGSIREGGVADLVAVADAGQSPAEALGHLRPEMVVIGGRIRLVSLESARRVRVAGFRHIGIEGRGEWLVDAEVPRLPGEDRLGGKQVFM